MIGNSYGKFIQRDTLAKGKAFEVPLIRLGFPLFDRHHLHRQTTWGYEGAMNIVTTLVNAVLEKHCEAIILSDSSKFSAVHPYPLGPAGRFNRVITDDRLPDACRGQLLRSGLTVDIVPYI